MSPIAIAYDHRRATRFPVASDLGLRKRTAIVTLFHTNEGVDLAESVSREFRKLVVVTPKKSEIFNSGYIERGRPLLMEEAPRAVLLIQNQGETSIKLTDSHWHKDLGVLEPGAHEVLVAAAVAANTDASIGTLSVQVLQENV